MARLDINNCRSDDEEAIIFCCSVRLDGEKVDNAVMADEDAGVVRVMGRGLVPEKMDRTGRVEISLIDGVDDDIRAAYQRWRNSCRT